MTYVTLAVMTAEADGLGGMFDGLTLIRHPTWGPTDHNPLLPRHMYGAKFYALEEEISINAESRLWIISSPTRHDLRMSAMVGKRSNGTDPQIF